MVFHFTYRADFENGLTEFEFDHVFVGTYDAAIYPDKNEVSDYGYRSIDEIGRHSAQSALLAFTTWFHLAFPLVNEKMVY